MNLAPTRGLRAFLVEFVRGFGMLWQVPLTLAFAREVPRATHH